MLQQGCTHLVWLYVVVISLHHEQAGQQIVIVLFFTCGCFVSRDLVRCIDTELKSTRGLKQAQKGCLHEDIIVTSVFRLEILSMESCVDRSAGGQVRNVSFCWNFL
jgi:hypothetical protein